METFKSSLSGAEFPISERIAGNSVHQALLAKIKEQHPDFKVEDSLALSELNVFRFSYLTDFLNGEMSNVGDLEKVVLDAIGDSKSITSLVDSEENQVKSTYGERIADRVAAFGGSWKFIILFSVIIVLWIGVNALMFSNKGFDPYPFILLNLILSCLAALQAPVIMMSQNRQEEKDRKRARNDYMINLKSELEIRMLHEKIDHLIIRQQQDIINTQSSQLAQMKQFIERIEATKPKGG